MKNVTKKILPVALVLLCCFECKSQDAIIPDRCDSVYYVSILDSLKSVYHNCRNIPSEYELAFYTAVSHYPELKEINIEMKLKNFNFSMAARPAKKLLSSRNKRVYRVYANIKKNFIGVLPAALNYNQKVGIIGHELAHILEYSGKNSRGLFRTGLGYLSIPYRRRMEARADIEAIKRGMGWQLYDFEHYLYDYSNATEKYKKKKARVYMNDKQIKEYILEFYQKK